MENKEEEMSGFWICKPSKNVCCPEKCHHGNIHRECGVFNILCHGHKCKQLTMKEYAIWRLTHEKVQY